ncbi:TIGR04222 domain-containing membrane protein [Blastococcus litoris]|uniref:TIGR04222 domain-containing membrane protein n=1 Tax=Blastococcus litoris TaxID=2171622 RepID=UPI000E30A734|nr:TIGR04222 domain-containing membrane protein [Blastococcus litoris]
MPAEDLDLYDVAYLAGGPGRLVDTAVIALLGTGRLRLRCPGQLVTADLARRHPVEAAVLDAVGPTGHRSVDTVQWRLADDDRVATVGRRLQALGLLGRAGALARHPHVRSALAPTRAGRRVLRGLRERTGEDELRDVALRGRRALADARRRSEIFDRPSTVLAPPGGRDRHDVDHSDPRLAAYRTGGSAAAAGAYLIGPAGGMAGGVP